MKGRLDGKVAVVTGGASGIGEGTARRFLEEGARCVLADLQDERGEELVKELGGDTFFVHADVSDEAQVANLVEQAVARFGRLDCVFNNAGILGAVGPSPRRRRVPGNARWMCCSTACSTGSSTPPGHDAAAIGHHHQHGEHRRAEAGLGPHAYTTAKHAVVGLTQSVATELGRHQIRVNAIAPGATVSGMTAYVSTGDASALDEASRRIARKVPLGRPGYPLDIANAALYLASDESSWTNGAVLVIDAGGEVIGDRNHRFFEMDSEIVQEAGRKTH